MSERRGEGAERGRMQDQSNGTAAWRRWGPYLAERAWGTVREDYSRSGEAWSSFPYDHARSRAYRWNEDGLAGISDDQGLLCFGLALWNGRDPVLKERIFGLASPEGNHGEDAKEYWWYLDATPTYSWMRWRYAYPQTSFPYADLLDENRTRSRDVREVELVDTGALDSGWWEVTADFAKAAPDDLLIRITVRNAGHVQAMLDVIPTLWFRNTWSWGLDDRRPVIRAAPASLVAEHHILGRWVLAHGGDPELLFCENETNTQRIWGMPGGVSCPKDGINDNVVHGAPTVNTSGSGTKAAARYRLTVPAGSSAEIRLRLAPDDRDLTEGFGEVMRRREREADEYYASLTPADLSSDEALVVRQASAGLLWSRQFYHYDVHRWLIGDPRGAPPPVERWQGRNVAWQHLDAHDIVSVPDKWEYPWASAWGGAFNAVAMARIDSQLAKEQLLLELRDWYMHPGGQLPAHEWGFSDVNPPVQAWAALRIWDLDGRQDTTFLERVFHKLLLNVTWWLNRKDGEGHNVFEGGFLGIDNIGPFDRSAVLPQTGPLEQADGIAWTAMYCANMLELALALAAENPAYEDIAATFFDYFTRIAVKIDELGLWDDEDGFYYDLLKLDDGTTIPLRARSMMGLVALFAVTVLPASVRDRLPDFTRRMDGVLTNRSDVRRVAGHITSLGDRDSFLLSIVSPSRLRKILRTVLDEQEFLSPYGLRSLSRVHRDHPLGFRLGDVTSRLDYEPGESRTGLFGGNVNWRGPIWFPLNYLFLESLRRYHEHLGDGYTVEFPAGSGHRLTLSAVSAELRRRLTGIFRLGSDQRRPVFGGFRVFQQRPFRDQLLFYEYFDGDSGAGLGASHQTGWTALVADLLLDRRP